jgi:hypothetical protein
MMSPMVNRTRPFYISVRVSTIYFGLDAMNNPQKEHIRRYNYGDFRLILFTQRRLHICQKYLCTHREYAYKIEYKYIRSIRKEYFAVCGEYVLRHEIDPIQANFALKTPKNDRS